jgi:hypothetical protein
MALSLPSFWQDLLWCLQRLCLAMVMLHRCTSCVHVRFRGMCGVATPLGVNQPVSAQQAAKVLFKSF